MEFQSSSKTLIIHCYEETKITKLASNNFQPCYKRKKKIKLRSFKSSEHINEKGDGPYRGFDY